MQFNLTSVTTMKNYEIREHFINLTQTIHKVILFKNIIYKLKINFQFLITYCNDILLQMGILINKQKKIEDYQQQFLCFDHKKCGINFLHRFLLSLINNYRYETTTKF